MSAPEQYTVVHESPMGLYSDGTERIDYGIAGGVWDSPPVNHLAYCRDLAAERHIEGRYFIARVTEIPDPEPEVGP